MTSEADLQVEFVQNLLCDERINHDQFNFLICNISNDQPSMGMDAISELGLANEYRNFKSKLERNHQDTEYQISMIKDMISEVKGNMTRIQKENNTIIAEYEDKQKAYDTVKGRWSRFPDNPRFIKEMEDAEKDFGPIRDSYLNGQKQIKEYEDSIQVWEKQLDDLSRSTF
jgi:chromosome segregation ATPase